MWWKHGLYGLKIAVIVAMPSVIALGYHRLTGDPTLRPLAQSIETSGAASLAFGVVPVGGRISLHGADTPRARRMADEMRKTLHAKGVEARITLLHAAPDAPAGVLFVVDRNRIGPYPLSRAAEGVRAAVAAYHSANRG